jgi:AcrR family transcriptional regulator
MDGMTTASAAGLEPGADLERKAPGRPRSAKADEAIIAAVIALLQEGQNVGTLSMEAVAARAGVGKATIYRRWPNKDALLIDMVRTMKGPPPEPTGESVRDDLIMLVGAARSKRMEEYGRVTACMLPELVRDAELRKAYAAVAEPRRNVMRAVLRRGIETGELRADLDVELTLLMLVSPGLTQNVLNLIPDAPSENFAEKLVDAVLRGAAA